MSSIDDLKATIDKLDTERNQLQQKLDNLLAKKRKTDYQERLKHVCSIAKSKPILFILNHDLEDENDHREYEEKFPTVKFTSVFVSFQATTVRDITRSYDETEVAWEITEPEEYDVYDLCSGEKLKKADIDVTFFEKELKFQGILEEELEYDQINDPKVEGDRHQLEGFGFYHMDAELITGLSSC